MKRGVHGPMPLTGRAYAGRISGRNDARLARFLDRATGFGSISLRLLAWRAKRMAAGRSSPRVVVQPPSSRSANKNMNVNGPTRAERDRLDEVLAASAQVQGPESHGTQEVQHG